MCEPPPVDPAQSTIIDVAQVVAAIAGIVIAALVALMPFARRPRLSLLEDTARVHSRVETTGRGAVPHIRLLASNGKRRRAAKGTRVLVEGYYQQGHGGPLVSLAHPSLGWPSAPEAAETATVTIFPGGHRPIGLGKLIRVRLDRGDIMRPVALDNAGRPLGGFPHYEDEPDAVGWYLWLELAFGLDLLDNRDKLPPVDDGYVLRLMIGADDGAARAFEVDLDWDGDPNLGAAEVLASALSHLAVREV